MLLKSDNYNFSYLHYQNTLKKYLEAGYQFIRLAEAENFTKKNHIVILRHDIDKSVKKAVDFAEIENRLGIKATYYVRLHSNYYNPFGYIVHQQIERIIELGHEVGLHSEFFDFGRITEENPIKIFENEMKVFEIIFGIRPGSYSLHRTTGSSSISEIQESTGEIRKKFEIIGSYEPKILDNFKYLSDSSGIWREGCFSEHVGKHERLQILIHPEWWFNENINLEESLV